MPITKMGSVLDSPDLLPALLSAKTTAPAVGERFGVATGDFTQGLYERADGLESERAEREPPDDDDDGARRSADSYVDDVRGMFDGLENALRSS